MNEMTMNDTAGKEKITIHAQYDMGTTVEHDQTNTVNNDFTETIKKNASITMTEGNLTHDVKTGTASYHVKGAVTQKFENIWDSKVTDKVSIKANSDILIDSDTKITLVTGGSQLVMESERRHLADGLEDHDHRQGRGGRVERQDHRGRQCGSQVRHR